MHLSQTALGKNAWIILSPQFLLTPNFQMKVSELALHLRSYLQQNPDCDVKLYSESVVYDDVFDANDYEDVTDIRHVNDWPLPGESVITAENTGKHLVIFYDQETVPHSSRKRSVWHDKDNRF